jgi:hypothetical protein
MLRLLFHIIGAHCVSVRDDSGQEYSDTPSSSNGADFSSTAIPNDGMSRKRDRQDSLADQGKHVGGRKLRKLEPVSYHNLHNPWSGEADEESEVEAHVETSSEADDSEVETQQHEEPQVSAAKAHAKLTEKLRRFNARLREKLKDVRNCRKEKDRNRFVSRAANSPLVDATFFISHEGRLTEATVPVPKKRSPRGRHAQMVGKFHP